MQFTSGQFHADMFLMANNVQGGYKTSEDATAPVTEYVVVTPGEGTVNKIVLKNVPVDYASIHVRGWEVADTSGVPTTVPAGKILFDSTADEAKILYVNKEEFEAGKTVDVTYEVQYDADTVKEIMIDNRSTAIGEVICKWPVYGSSDVCTDSAIRGYVLMKIFKARVTAAPGFDTSYKSAATNQITLSAMDPKDHDGAVYSIAYIDSAADNG